MALNAVKTTHNLDFEACAWPRDPSIMLFKIGTCNGQWYSTDLSYTILSILNDNPGNGHLNDVFEWFEYSCKRDGKFLIIEELMNDRFREHLILKRGFITGKGNGLIKFP